MKKAFFIVALFVAALSIQIHSAKAYAPQEVVVNGNFEASPTGTGWTDSSGAIGVWLQTHSGSRSAFLSPFVPWSSASIAQIVQLPSNATSITFSAWAQFYSYETGFTVDSLLIQVLNADNLGDVWFSREFIPNVNETGPGFWTQLAADVTSHKGQRAFVFIFFYEDGEPWSYGYVDDVSITAQLSDTTAPTTALTALPTAPNGTNSYYTYAPTINLAATDDAGGSGIAKTFYNWDGTPFAQYAGPLVAPEGTHTLTYYSTDAAGNTESAKSATFKVDTGKPTTSANVSAPPDGTNGWYKTAPTITLTRFDAGSGIASTLYSWDGASYTPAAGNLAVPAGTHTLSLYSIDGAGNTEAVQSLTYKVDLEDPILTLLEHSYAETMAGATTTLKGTASDTSSGLASVTVNGTAVPVDPAGAFQHKLALGQGDNAITIVATDQAGRSATLTKSVVYRKAQVLGAVVEIPFIKRIRKNTVKATTDAKARERITITGENFTPKTKVKVGKRTPTKIVYKNSKTIVILIPLSKYKVGKHNITVTNPDGQSSTKVKALTITR